MPELREEVIRDLAQRGTGPGGFSAFVRHRRLEHELQTMPGMTRALLSTFTLLAAFAVGCGGSTDSDGANAGGQAGGGTGGSTGGSGGSSGGGTGGGGGTCESLVPCCDAKGNPVNPICPTPNNPECPTGASWPPTGICSASTTCSPSQPCAASEWCDYPDNLCGAGSPGACKQRPQGCDLLYAPVCTCDGQQAGNACAGQSGGQDVSAEGGCPAPQGMFGCGPIFCTVGQQYCQMAISDVGGYPNEFACKALPTACGSSPSCACLKSESCGDMCKADSAGNLQVTCPGG